MLVRSKLLEEGAWSIFLHSCDYHQVPGENEKTHQDGEDSGDQLDFGSCHQIADPSQQDIKQFSVLVLNVEHKVNMQSALKRKRI